MAVTDVEIISRKLSVLGEYVQRARRRRPSQVDALLDDQDLQDALSLSLLVAVQEAVDIAFHLAAQEGWGIPASNAEAFELLARTGVLSSELSHALASVLSLRNRIEHDYASLDLPRLWAELPAGLDQLERYGRCIADLLAKHTDTQP